MKRLSLKLKLTLLYSFFMTLLTCTSLALMFSFSNKEMLSSTQHNLKKQVDESLEDIEAEDGKLDIDSDFYDLDDGIYLSMYSSDGSFLFGRSPYGFNTHPAFRDGQLQTIKDGEEQWYIFDLKYEVEDYGSVFVRGITSITKAESGFRITLRFALILLPLLVILTAVIGYLFTSHTLRPVQKITETVQKIQADKDLSRRVGLKNGNDEIHQLAETFDRLLQEIEEAFLREKQFTSDVSHELRTPVTVLLAQCDALLQDETLTPQQYSQVQLLEKKARDMAQMISHLLLLSRADQGRQKLQLERLNLSELTELVAEEQQILAEERRITIETKIEPDIYGFVDETFYIRMLVNLISNAIYYGNEGGHIFLSLTLHNHFIEGSVEDDGIGIAPDQLPHIWERFYRADTSRTDGSHSGLGLSMVKWIVEAHGGTISAESSLGKGSTFTFLFPKEKK